VFPGNPWPNGHAIKDFAWSGRLDPGSGIWFDLHLETDNYYADDENPEPDYDNEDSEGDWDSKIVWHNYHSCTVSSTYWGGDGFQVGSKEKPLDFDALTMHEFQADPLPVKFLDRFPWVDENQTRAFNIYLLGHDMCADHAIRFPQRLDTDSFAIDWRGRIALTYAGDREFRYSFRAPEIWAQFGGVFLPDGTAKRAALELVSPFIVDTGSLRLAEEDGQLVFKLK
jgi:hypothetical protein